MNSTNTQTISDGAIFDKKLHEIKEPIKAETYLYEESISNPLIKELSSMIGDNQVKLPYIEKNKILMSPGIWNGKMYTAEEIKKAFKNTDWENKQNKFLFYDHEDRKASEWVGEIMNETCSEEGVVTADLVYYDPILAIKMAYGKPKIGISPKVRGEESNNEMRNFVYENFSVVVVPAVKTAWINNSEQATSETPAQKLSLEVKPMTEENTKPVEETQQVAESKTETMSEELSAFVAFYNAEKEKNPSCSMMDICNAFVSKDKKPEEEPKEEKKPEEEKAPVPPVVPTPEEQMSQDKKVDANKDELSDKAKEVEDLKKVVQTMSEQIAKLNEKLDAPARVAVKSNQVVNELASQQDSDMAFMNYLKEFK
jgi:hypothetical protein